MRIEGRGREGEVRKDRAEICWGKLWRCQGAALVHVHTYTYTHAHGVQVKMYNGRTALHIAAERGLGSLCVAMVEGGGRNLLMVQVSLWGIRGEFTCVRG